MFIKVNVQTWLLVLLKIETSQHMLSQRQLDINGHGKGDTATYTRSDFTEGLEPKDIREASEPQGISHGFNPYPMPMGVRAGERPVSMTSGGTRFIPWKVRTGTEVPTMCNGHAREPSGKYQGQRTFLVIAMIKVFYVGIHR